MLSLENIDAYWHNSSRYDRNRRKDNKETLPSFQTVLNDFRSKHPNDPPYSSSFGATLQGQPAEQSAPNSRSVSPRPTPKCICGKMHRFSDCFYHMEHKRPKDWKPNADILKKMEDLMKTPWYKSAVEKAKQRSLRNEASSTSLVPHTSTIEAPAEPHMPSSNMATA